MAARKGAKRNHRGPTRPKQRAFLSGTLRVGARGSATVETAEGPFFIPHRRLHEAMNGDQVQVRPIGGYHGELPLAAVVHVSERAVASFAARFVDEGAFQVLVPLDDRLLHDFLVDPADDSPRRAGVRDGDLACARIVRYPTVRAAGVACVERAIGGDGESVAIEAIVASHDLPVAFAPDVVEQARALRVDVAEALAQPGRRDLRDRFVVTVDPDDARDFDDAVSVEALPEGGWLLGVHIADVANYVAWGSPIDLAARERATSVYLADRVIPMLPEELSCDVCSLRPGEDRLAMTVDLTLDAQGRVSKSAMYPSVIRSKGRFAYRQVDAILAGGAAADAPDAAVEGLPEGGLEAFFGALDRIRVLRKGLRRERGAIEFVSTEAKVVLDDGGRPVGVSLRRPTPATSLIEEAMLAANEAVARRLTRAGVPTVYRVHEPPDHDRLAALVPLLDEIGCLEKEARAALVAGDPHAVQGVLDAVAGRPEEELVSTLLLRAMKRAAYAPSDDGHYGLGAAAYCHFTSPIRRYPDLMAHRALKALVAGGMRMAQRRAFEEAVPTICRHSSKMERVAAAASFESQAVKLAEYMGGFIGQVFEGVVSSVHPFGAFVRLVETGAEGLLHTRGLGGGWWSFDGARHVLSNEEAGVALRLGQTVEVRVRSVDAFQGKIDLALPDLPPDALPADPAGRG